MPQASSSKKHLAEDNHINRMNPLLRSNSAYPFTSQFDQGGQSQSKKQSVKKNRGHRFFNCVSNPKRAVSAMHMTWKGAMTSMIPQTDELMQSFFCCKSLYLFFVADKTQLKKNIPLMIYAENPDQRLFMSKLYPQDDGGLYKYERNVVCSSFLLLGFIFIKHLYSSVTNNSKITRNGYSARQIFAHRTHL